MTAVVLAAWWCLGFSGNPTAPAKGPARKEKREKQQANIIQPFIAFNSDVNLIEKEGISLCMCHDLYFEVNCISVVLEDKCVLYSAAVIYYFSLSGSCRRNFSVPELGAVFPEGFVAWIHVSQESHSHYCISIFLQCSAFFSYHLPWSVPLIIFSAGLNSPQHLFLIL